MTPLQLYKYLTTSKNFFLICGPCVIESESHAMFMAKEIAKVCKKLEIPLVFKASFDKANRTSHKSFRGLGIKEGLRILKKIKETYTLPILTDIHETIQAQEVAEVADILQIPAFLCRQTDLLRAAQKTGKIVNIKKGQFLSPQEMKNVVDKFKHKKNLMVTERGSTFGYNNLVVDMRSFPILRQLKVPVVYDATHSLQLPGAASTSTGGLREFVFDLARASVATGIDGLFVECHDNPEKALSDATTQWPLNKLEEMLKSLLKIHQLVKGMVKYSHQ